MPTGFVRPREVAAIQSLSPRGLQTSLDLNGVNIEFFRTDEDSGEDASIGVYLIRLKELNQQNAVAAGVGIDQQESRFRIRGFSPLPLMIGDWFITPDNRHAIVIEDAGAKRTVRTLYARIAQGTA